MAVVCALQPIPNQGAHTREDLFSIALSGVSHKSDNSGPQHRQPSTAAQTSAMGSVFEGQGQTESKRAPA